VLAVLNVVQSNMPAYVSIAVLFAAMSMHLQPTGWLKHKKSWPTLFECLVLHHA
jgi:hypothetical protein